MSDHSAPPPRPAGPKPSAAQWYVTTAAGEQFGPVPPSTLREWIQSQRVTADCQVFQEGWPQWKRAAEQFPELALRPIQPALSSMDFNQASPPKQRTLTPVAARQRKKEGEKQFFVRIGIGCVIVFALGFGFFMAGAMKDKYGGEAKASILAEYARHPNQALVRQLVDRHHEDCVRQCYDAGGRRRATSFDFVKYRLLMHAALDPQLLTPPVPPRPQSAAPALRPKTGR